MRKLYAKWTRTIVRNATQPTEYTTPCILMLRSGKQGKGGMIGAVYCWTDSLASLEEADRIRDAIEQKARDAGYTILPEEREY